MHITTELPNHRWPEGVRRRLLILLSARPQRLAQYPPFTRIVCPVIHHPAARETENAVGTASHPCQPLPVMWLIVSNDDKAVACASSSLFNACESLGLRKDKHGWFHADTKENVGPPSVARNTMKGTTSSAFVKSPDMAAARCTCKLHDAHDASRASRSCNDIPGLPPSLRGARCGA
jgi:hypothetical protein